MIDEFKRDEFLLDDPESEVDPSSDEGVDEEDGDDDSESPPSEE